MLGGSHSRLIDRLIVALDSNIIDHDGTIVATNGKKGWELRMEV